MPSRLVVVVWLGSSLVGLTSGQPIDEYQVKAAFLYNFAKFVEWPPSAFKTPQQPISICIEGQNPFGGALEEAIRGREIDGRVLTVHQISEDPTPWTCQVLFVAASERKRFQSLPAEFKAPGILTVGEAPWFGAEGGVINLKLEGGKVRFEINLAAAERQQVRISSKLLTLALVVKK